MLDPRTILERAAEEDDAVDPELAGRAMELADELEKLKARIDEGNELLKELRARYDEIRKEKLPDVMYAAGLVNQSGKGSFTLRSGSTVYLSTDMHVHLPSAKKPRFYNWLKEQGHGDLVQEYVFPSTLKAFAKEQMSEGQELPDFLEALPYLKAVLRRS